MVQVTVRVDPIDRDIKLMLSELMSPEARSKYFADFAREGLEEAEQQNQDVLGRIPPHRTFVDGVEDADEDAVRPDGVIVYEFELVADLLFWVGDQLHIMSPYSHGGYKRGHRLFADGTEIPFGQTVPSADEYVFVNIVPYARKIEHGESAQAPDGVYEFVAMAARKRFKNIARIEFNYREVDGQRNPAIIIRMGGQ